MKICAIICEYNPFHNGHLYQIQTARALFPHHAVLCIMSGNFVQRGEVAIMHKSLRAKHAIQGGADIVIELPTVFATSNAELFAKGAIHLLSSIPDVDTLCFGAETADKEQFLHAAALLNSEPKEISAQIQQYVASGMSYAKAYADAWAMYIDPAFLRSPNNILGLEYTKAILAKQANIAIAPISRIGSAYSDSTLQNNYSSASAIRSAIQNHQPLGDNLPAYVKRDLPHALENHSDVLEKYAILTKTAEDLQTVCDCTEGLENAFLKAATAPLSLVEALTSARYTSSRIRRIALQNFLSISETLTRDCLQNPLYLKVLACKKNSDSLLTALHDSSFPLLSRGLDGEGLTGIAKLCYERDLFAEKIYALFYPIPTDKTIFI